MAKAVKILLIDESPVDRDRIAESLRPRLADLHVIDGSRPEDFSRALEGQHYDLAIVERRISWSCGLRLGGILRDRYPDRPLLMHAKDDRLDTAVEAMRAGFDDYVPKTPGIPGRLPRAVESVLEHALKQRREVWVETRVQDLLSRLEVGVFRSTTRGAILYANSAFCRIFGIPSWREAPAWTLRTLLADPADEARISRELRRTGSVKGVELRIKHPGRGEQWIALTQSLKPGGEGLGMIEGLVEDITDRKRKSSIARRREEEERHHHRLETVGRLAGGVAHDFNNLLTAINGYSDLLMANLTDDDPLKENVEEIRKAGSRAALLTRNLLAFSSRLMLMPRRVDLNGFIRELSMRIEASLGRSARLQLALGSGIGEVHVDAAHLEHVLFGLVQNSRDSMPAGGTLTLRTGQVLVTEPDDFGPGEALLPPDRLRPGPYGLLIVEDTGNGMSGEVLARAFEPFYSTKPMGKGLGMGLSTAYGILKQSGGAIVADSLPGQGTRMRLYLPLAQPAQEPKTSTV
jgi:two-component system cell cycle sensor histidine kinase/response regulator CckA